MTSVLYADPDPVFVQGVQLALEKRGLQVDTVCDGYLALTRLQLGVADVCALDASLKSIDSLTVLRKARSAGALTPILIIGGGATSADRMIWFDAGADDVLGKPFDPDELAIRFKSAHRRRSPQPDRISFGPLELDVLSGTFLLEGRLMELTPREHGFLRVLMARPGFVVPKDRLCRAVFGYDAGAGALDVLVCRLRRKLSRTGWRSQRSVAWATCFRTSSGLQIRSRSGAWPSRLWWRDAVERAALCAPCDGLQINVTPAAPPKPPESRAAAALRPRSRWPSCLPRTRPGRRRPPRPGLWAGPWLAGSP